VPRVVHVIDGRSYDDLLGQLSTLRGSDEPVVSLGRVAQGLDDLGASVVRPGVLGLPALHKALRGAHVVHVWSRRALWAAALAAPRAALVLSSSEQADRAPARCVRDRLTLAVPCRAAVAPDADATILPPAVERPDAGAREAIRRELGLGDEPVVVMASSLTVESDYRRAIWLGAVLEAVLPGTATVMSTRGPRVASARRAQQDMTPPGRVLWASAGWTIGQLASAGDLAFVPHGRCSCAVALAAAMASGTAVLACDGPAVREIAGDAVAVVSADRTRELAMAAHRLMGDAPLRARLGVRARELSARFSPQAARTVLDDLYRRVATRGI
jgi:hypothetical protein